MKYSQLQIFIISTFVLFLFGCSSGQSSKVSGQKNDSSKVKHLSVTLPSVPDTQAVQIIFPKGGEKLIKGKTYTFKWIGGHSIITIFLVDSSLESKGASVSLADRIYGIPNRGIYHYTFPDRIKEGTYKVRIGKKESGYFQVVKKAVNQ